MLVIPLKNSESRRELLYVKHLTLIIMTIIFNSAEAEQLKSNKK